MCPKCNFNTESNWPMCPLCGEEMFDATGKSEESERTVPANTPEKKNRKKRWIKLFLKLQESGHSKKGNGGATIECYP